MNKTEILLLWQQAEDILGRIQTAGAGHNGLVQDIETIREDLSICISEAMDKPEWRYIPFDGEVAPDPELNEVK